MRKLRFFRRSTLSDERYAFILTVTALAIAFLFGGGARADIVSLTVLRPLAAVICGLALITLVKEHWEGRRALLIFCIVVVCYVALQLVPLPSTIWQALPGRSIVNDIDSAAGLTDVPRPFSLAPSTTWNALFSLLVPLSVLLPGVQLGRNRLRTLGLIMAGLIVFSALLGVLQTIAGQGSALYFYRITNEGMPVGLFSNRNHQAFFLATVYPLLAVVAGFSARDEQSARVRFFACVFTAAAITPVLLATGSRGGLILGVVAAACCTFLYRRAEVRKVIRRASSPLRWQVPLAIFAVFVMAGITLIAARTTGLNRLLNTGSDAELRPLIWKAVPDIAMTYFPWGSGIGSFVEVFRIGEPESLLSPEYVNHAHNDLLEVWITGGLPGLVLVLALVLGIFATAAKLAARKQFRVLNKLGAVVATLLLLASLADYPLRAPSMFAYFILALLWLSSQQDVNEGDERAQPRPRGPDAPA